MPYVDRTLNHDKSVAQSLERVKIEEPQSDSQGSSLRGDSKQLAEGKWNEDENLKFVIFVNYYQDIFSNRYKRKTSKIFKTFEDYLHDRTAAQCRSHYQKIIMKFRTVAKIRKHYEQLYGKEVYRREFESFTSLWQTTHPPLKSKEPQIKQVNEISIQTDPVEERPKTTICSNCVRMIDDEASFQPQSISPFPMTADYNPFYANYLAMMTQMGFNSYNMFPPRNQDNQDPS